MADECHAKMPEQCRDSMDKNAETIIIPNGREGAHALIGSAIRVMPSGECKISRRKENGGKLLNQKSNDDKVNFI